MNTYDELFDYLNTIYDDDTLMIILEFEAYYEIMYACKNSIIYNRKKYELNKLKDITGELEKYGKQLFNFNKLEIYKNQNKSKKKPK